MFTSPWRGRVKIQTQKEGECSCFLLILGRVSQRFCPVTRSSVCFLLLELEATVHEECASRLWDGVIMLKATSFYCVSVLTHVRISC